MSRSSRRLFLERSMWATASAFAFQHASVGRASPLQEGEKEAGPSDRLSVAVVGVNGRGQSHVHHYVRNPKTRITHICDVDESVGQKVIEAIAEKQGGEKPAYVRDMRTVF
ncbi:MAG: gfo/Idh/MocA family oxidoreductase, partial [Pirellulaceae bacterium]